MFLSSAGNETLIPGCVSACPGCAHRKLTMHESLHQKLLFLKKTLAPWSDMIEEVISPQSSERLGYREKVILNAEYTQGNWVFGMMRFDKLIPIPDCPVHSARVNQIAACLREFLPPFEDFPLAFFVQNGRQLTLVVKGKSGKALNWLSDNCKGKLDDLGLDGLWIHYNPSAGRRIFEKTPRILVWGKPWSTDEYGMQYGPQAFQQLLPELYHHSLSMAREWLNPGPESAIIDLYSGTGNSLKYWGKAGAQTIGVELNGEAVECAKVNNPGISILRGKCEERIPQLQKWKEEMAGEEKKILVYANPPRTGIDEKTWFWLLKKVLPEKLAYLSCSPGTLSKNLAAIESLGYRVRKIIPYDFFPITRNVETLALIDRRD